MVAPSSISEVQQLPAFEDFNLPDFDLFDPNFAIQEVDMDAMMSSTQDFWGNFPGEVEMYY